ncbi:MAG: ribosome-binding factor RbfA [Ignavibacteria bacterium]|nr:ribosome-binding factor RbfA [Ignavibacteria bacterium]
MSSRIEKVASVVKRTLAQPLSDFAREHNAGLVTVTSVLLTRDLQIAKVYFSIYGGTTTPEKFLSLLEVYKSQFRQQLGSQLRLRYTPDIRFFIDDTLDKMEHIQKLLDSVKTVTEDTSQNEIE